MKYHQHDALDEACARVRGRLEWLVDGALPPLDEARDRGHLEACAACACEHEAWNVVLAGIRRACAPPAGELAFATDGLDARVAAARSPRRYRLRSLAGRAAVSIATAAAGVIGLVSLELVGIDFDAMTGLPERPSEILPGIHFDLPDWPHQAPPQGPLRGTGRD